MDLTLLDDTLAAAGEPAFRARQVWRWTANGARGYEEMTDLPAALRERLTRGAVLVARARRRGPQRRRHGQGAVPHKDGRAVEAVLMRYRDGRRSICVSSQSGCPLTCTFCATGPMKFGRNLTASEILDQVLHFRRIEPVNHLVFMGMGEPMMNLDHVLDAHASCPTSASPTAARRSPRSAGRRASTASPSATCRSGSPSPSTPPRTGCARGSCRSTTATRSRRSSPRASATTSAATARCSSST